MDAARIGEFAIPFTYALVALRNADSAGEGCTLTPEQVHAVIEAFRLLKGQAPSPVPEEG